ncbi:DUF916 domain-containing protein [Solwaraspora sp. WMMD1047]|uniref:WxL protein peptidoglycan domain-containing protein n=1 Tax=Solwaraspora sp. WMMD1047 TaxID=3016102 RepID=UPI00241691D6|nr:DUF916 domain-containing protein [Solwaraspora sp. WMMD1047]MDG4832968.1 DUF916 domain-containing protein [Solwaraspora sp. WMMD1047]
MLLAVPGVPAALLGPSPAHAAAAQQPGAVTWGVAPSSPKGPTGRSAFDYKLDPGATLTDYVAVTNHSSQPLTLAVYASDAFTTAQGGFDLLAGDRAPTDVGSWVQFATRTVTVPSTSRLDIPFRIVVPENATPGDHAGGIVAALAAAGADAQGNQVAVDHRVGARIYLRVTGELRPEFTITDLRVRHDSAANPFTGGRVTATFTVRNTGNVRLTGEPSLRVAGPVGLARRTERTDALPEILPGNELAVTVRVRGVPPLFRLAVTAQVRPAAVGDQVLDPAPVPVTAEAGVWAVPWLQLALLVVLAAAVWSYLLMRRRRRRRAARDLARAVIAARAEGRAEAAASAGKVDPGEEPADGDPEPATPNGKVPR